MKTEPELLAIKARADAASVLVDYAFIVDNDIPALVESHREALRRIEELEAALKNAGEVICGEYCLNIRKALDGGKEG